MEVHMEAKKNNIPEIKIHDCVTDNSVMPGFWEAYPEEQKEIDQIIADDFDFE